MTILEAFLLVGLIIIAGVLAQLIHYVRWLVGRMNALSSLLQTIKTITDIFENTEEIHTKEAVDTYKEEIEVLKSLVELQNEEYQERENRVDLLEDLLESIGVDPDRKYSLSDIEAMHSAIERVLK